jgi:hypothetical protein
MTAADDGMKCLGVFDKVLEILKDKVQKRILKSAKMFA